MSLWWRLVRFGFWLLYNPFAFTYDWVSYIVSLGAWRCWGAAALKHVDSTGTVLELAHGTGHLQVEMASRDWKTVGYDLSPAMGRIAQRRLLRHNLQPRLIRGMAQQLPFPHGAFSTVVSTFPTDFITKPETLTEISRILTQQGRLVVVPTALFTSGGVLRRILEFAYRITGQSMDPPEGEVESHFLQQWQPLFDDHGFSLETAFEDCGRSQALVLIARKKVWK